jgi:hypothetical protein
MTIYERPRTDPIAGHAYTLPVVREVPIRAPQATSLDLRGLAAPAVHADSHPR